MSYSDGLNLWLTKKYQDGVEEDTTPVFTGTLYIDGEKKAVSLWANRYAREDFTEEYDALIEALKTFISCIESNGSAFNGLVSEPYNGGDSGGNRKGSRTKGGASRGRSTKKGGRRSDW